MEGHTNTCECTFCTKEKAARSATEKLWFHILTQVTRDIGRPADKVLTYFFGDAENFRGELAGLQKQNRQLKEENAFLVRLLTQQNIQTFKEWKDEENKE